MDDRLINEAIFYTTLKAFYDDEERAWREIKTHHIDFELPFASYLSEFASPTEMDRLNNIWCDVRRSYDLVRIPYEIIPYSGQQEDVHFLYAAGRTELLEKKKLVYIGAVMPSLQARKDTALSVIEAVKNDYTIMAPFEAGLGPYALSVALKNGGNVCAVLPCFLSRCPNEKLLSLMEGIYNSGLLLSPFSPYTKSEKWHVVLRNRFLSSFGDGFYLPEEKDGGPGWAVFDQAIKNGKRCAISSSSLSNPNFSWCQERGEKGVLEIKKPRDIKLLFTTPKKRKKVQESEDS